MLIATTERLAGFEVAETLGEVFGISVRSRNVFATIGASLKSLIGGEIGIFTTMLQQAREQAIQRMVAEAEKRGGDAIVMMRFDSGEIAPGVTEIVAYGTAVKTRTL